MGRVGNREHRDVRADVAGGAPRQAQLHPQTLVADGERTVPWQRRASVLAAIRRPQPRHRQALPRPWPCMLRGHGGLRRVCAISQRGREKYHPV